MYHFLKRSLFSYLFPTSHELEHSCDGAQPASTMPLRKTKERWESRTEGSCVIYRSRAAFPPKTAQKLQNALRERKELRFCLSYYILGSLCYSSLSYNLIYLISACSTHIKFLLCIRCCPRFQRLIKKTKNQTYFLF